MRVNPFSAADAGEYDDGRPYFHPSAIRRFVQITGVHAVSTAVDVACGTGMSIEALRAVAESCAGLDLSEPMLTEAKRRGRGPLVCGRAEQLPFGDETVRLLTVALGLHWFERQAFLQEARRVLAERSWLLVYDLGFCSRLQGAPEFGDWLLRYQERFPPPPRQDPLPTAPESEAMGFELAASEVLRHERAYDLSGLIAFVKTQSRVTHSVQQGGDTIPGAVTWLRESLTPFFGPDHRVVEFDGSFQLLQKAG